MVPRRNTRRRKRTFYAERAKQNMKDRVIGNVRKNEAKNSTEHRTVGSNKGVGKMKGTTKKQQKVGNLGNSRSRDGTTMAMTPIAIG